jgi:hypothetical protein
LSAELSPVLTQTHNPELIWISEGILSERHWHSLHLSPDQLHEIAQTDKWRMKIAQTDKWRMKIAQTD